MDYPHYQVFFWGIALRLRQKPRVSVHLRNDGTAGVRFSASAESYSISDTEEIIADAQEAITICRRWEAGQETAATIARRYPKIGKVSESA